MVLIMKMNRWKLAAAVSGAAMLCGIVVATLLGKSPELAVNRKQTVGQQHLAPSSVAQVINTAFSELKWRPMDPSNAAGPQMAPLWGDLFSGGPYGALLRVPAGFESPVHAHSHYERVVQIKGTSIHWREGESRTTARRMKPGDYIMVPAGIMHVSAAASGEESIELLTQTGKFDFYLAPNIRK